MNHKKWLRQVKSSADISTRLIRFVWKIDQILFLSIAFFTVIPAVIPFVNIYIYKLIIDFVIEASRGDEVVMQTLYYLIAARFISYFVQEFSYMAGTFLDQLLWLKVPLRLNQEIFEKISTLDMQRFEDSEFKNLLEKVRDSYQFRPQRLIRSVMYLGQSSMQVLIATIAIAQLNWLMILLIVPLAIAELINQTKFSNFAWNIWGWNSEFRKRYWYLVDLIQDARSIKEIKIFELAQKFLTDIAQINKKFYTDNLSLSQKNLYYNTGFNIVSTIVLIGFEVYVIFQAISRKITVGDINFYTGVVNNFQSGLSGLFMNVQDVYESSLYVQSIFDLLDTKPILTESEDPIAFHMKSAPRIEFRNVDFSYPGSSIKVLSNFNLTIEPGEKVAFVGENGAGKSTIVKLITRFYDVDKGEILLNGVNVRDIRFSDLHKTFGVLFQDFNKYEYSIKDNILFGDYGRAGDKDALEDSVRKSGAIDVVNQFENKYDQVLGKTFEKGMELSGGQWQKIALARTFFRNAPILVLDEPTSAIDAKAESEIFERVEKLTSDKTVIIISHRFSTVRNADRIYVIGNGKVKESGSHEDLIKLGKQYATLFRLQAKGYN